MNKLPFVIWMVGWYFACNCLSLYAKRYNIEEGTEDAKMFANIVEIILWVWIGILLWHVRT